MTESQRKPKGLLRDVLEDSDFTEEDLVQEFGQVYSISNQIEDLKGAIRFARDQREVDPEKIALWGTSAGGGYGMIIAAEDKGCF